ncbi:MAG: LysR substrate-binding domain-containing protein [Sphingomonadaceae bacterium]
MPHRRNIDIDLLRSFVTIVEVRSFTRAAERLLRTQSAISLQMKRLEEQLGCRLFERGGRGVEPTQAGTLLLGYARRILAANDELVGRMAEPTVEGVVRIGTPEGFLTEHLAPLLARFTRAFPRARMTVASGPGPALKQAYADGRLDLLITADVGNEPDGQPLLRETLLWCVADGADQDLMHVAAGEPLPLILTTEPCPVRRAMIAALDAAGLPWRTVVEASSRAGVQAAVGVGLGIGALPRGSLVAGIHRLNSAEGLPPLPRQTVALLKSASASPATERLHLFLTSLFDGQA